MFDVVNYLIKYLMILNFSVIKKELLRLEEADASFEIPNEEIIEEYYNIRKLLDTYAHDMRRVISHPIHSLQWLKPGRLVSIKHADMDFGWGMVVAYGKRKASLYIYL